jgi:two-component system sensor histidine kinase ChiS
LTNLLSNAVKFTQSGSVSVTLARIPGGRFRLSVVDTGPGISSDELAHVFEEFYQAARPEGDKTEGSGLGLTITRQLVRMMEGELLARSEVGVGSTFEVVLPLRPRSVAVVFPDPPPDDGPLVLVVDDDPSSLALTSRWLGRAGMRVVESTDGAESLAILVEQAVEVLVLDIVLEGMGGKAILQRLRSDPRTADLPVVCISGCRPEEYGEPNLADACLVKPLAEEPFVAAVRDALEGKVGHNRVGERMDEHPSEEGP